MKCLGLSPHFSAATLFLVLAGADALAAKKPKKEQPPAPPAAEVDTTGIDPNKDIAQRFDLDGDGLLDDKERAAAVAFMAKQPAAAPAAATGGKIKKRKGGEAENLPERVVARFDANRDGTLDEAERAEAKKALVARGGGRMREELVKRFDKNGDGKLDADERAAAEAAVKNRKGRPMGEAPPVPAAEGPARAMP